MTRNRVTLALLFLVGGLAGLGYRTVQPHAMVVWAEEVDDSQEIALVAYPNGVVPAITFLINDDAVGQATQDTWKVFLPTIDR